MKSTFYKKNQYTILTTFCGIVFGLLFPLFSSVAVCLIEYHTVSLENIFKVQSDSYLLWVIDTAPFFLGFFSLIIGITEDRLVMKNKSIKATNSILEDTNRRIEMEIEAAKNIYNYFIPDKKVFRQADINYILNCKGCLGGDFLSIKELDDQKIGVFLGDCSGHGIAASLLFALSSTVILKCFNLFPIDPDKYMEYFNNELCKAIPDDHFITGIYGVIQRNNDGHSFLFCRAGHTYPILWKKSTNTVEIVKSDGVALGKFPNIKYSIMNIVLEKGDMLLLYTDGAIEQIDNNRQELEITGLMTFFQKACVMGLNSEKTNNYILKCILDYSKQTVLSDDISTIIIKI